LFISFVLTGSLQINGVREYLQESNEISDEELVDEDRRSASSPTLLLGLNKPASREDLLTDIPPRPVTDRLIAQFLNSKEPLLSMCLNPSHVLPAQKLTWDTIHRRIPYSHSPKGGTDSAPE
jgi:hypothetical protein